MKKDYLKNLIGLLLFGSNGIIASHIVLSSCQIVFFRSVLGSILLVVLYRLTGHKFTALSHRKDLAFMISSGIAMAADWLFLFEAFQQMMCQSEHHHQLCWTGDCCGSLCHFVQG